MSLSPAKKHKRLASTLLNRVIKEGKIVRPDECSSCGKKCKPDGHHPDYDKPLKVIWVCKLCHAAIHRLIIENLLKAAEGLFPWASPAVRRKWKPVIKKAEKELVR